MGCASLVQRLRRETGRRFGRRYTSGGFDTNKADSIPFHSNDTGLGAVFYTFCRTSTLPVAWICDFFGKSLSLCRNRSGRPHKWDTGRGGPAEPGRSSGGTGSALVTNSHHRKGRLQCRIWWFRPARILLSIPRSFYSVNRGTRCSGLARCIR